MVDRNIILAKAGSVKRHLNRVIEKCDTDLQTFLNDLDRQDSILFNLQMAIQNCIDIAAHIISEEGCGAPGSTNEMFYLLEERGYLDGSLTEKMVAAVGFRNLIVHEYGKVDLKQVFEVARKDIEDLNEYLRSIFKKLNIVDN
ncbi:MAG: type VII toxin-antitoxin system HepT family RNase toxin [bacterium]